MLIRERKEIAKEKNWVLLENFNFAWNGCSLDFPIFYRCSLCFFFDKPQNLKRKGRTGKLTKISWFVLERA